MIKANIQTELLYSLLVLILYEFWGYPSNKNKLIVYLYSTKEPSNTDYILRADNSGRSRESWSIIIIFKQRQAFTE